MTLQVFIGWDAREAVAYEVARFSMVRRTSVPMEIAPVMLADVQRRGIFTRPVEWRDGRRWCPISQAPMATDFANSRFLVPWLAKRQGWALFMDSDMLARDDLARLTALIDPSYAVMCVKHDHRPAESSKMDAQVQTLYARKNWSSLVLWNLDHPANARLTLAMVNGLPGRDLHRFCWLDDTEIGALPEAWNWLDGHSSPEIAPSMVHMTRGGPWLPEWRDVAYAEDWIRERAIMNAAELGRSGIAS